MRLDTMKEQEIKTRCETALEKLKALQPQLNAIVTFVDIDEPRRAASWTTMSLFMTRPSWRS